ncbi:MAG: cbb3-type cytochrome oxidase assembly protein CcoS [Cytophagales bacterium]
MAITFLLLFLWSVKTGQYKDDYTPSIRMLFDGTVNKEPKNQN